MEIKIKIKRPGKGKVVVNFSCTPAETYDLIKQMKHHKGASRKPIEVAEKNK